MKTNFCQTGNMHLGKGTAKKTHLTTVINGRVRILDKRGQVQMFILDFEKAFDTPLMNYLKANYLVIALVERHSGG